MTKFSRETLFPISITSILLLVALATSAAGDQTAPSAPMPTAHTDAASSNELAGRQSLNKASLLQHSEARRLAAQAAFKHSTEALAQLNQAALSGDVEAEYGLGQYYNWLIQAATPPGKATQYAVWLPLLNEIWSHYSSELTKMWADLSKLGATQAPKVALDRDRINRSLHWWLLAARHGEPESQGELGNEYQREANNFLMLFTTLGNVSEDPGELTQMIAAFKENCDQARYWLQLSMAQNDTPRSAKALGDMALYYGYGHASPSTARTIAVQSGCWPAAPNDDRMWRYMQQAADRGDEGSIYSLVQKYHDEEQVEQEQRLRQRLVSLAIADREIGLPDPCVRDGPKACMAYYGVPQLPVAAARTSINEGAVVISPSTPPDSFPAVSTEIPAAIGSRLRRLPEGTVLCSSSTDFAKRQEDLALPLPTHTLAPSCFYLTTSVGAVVLPGGTSRRVRVRLKDGEHAGQTAWTELNR